MLALHVHVGKAFGHVIYISSSFLSFLLSILQIQYRQAKLNVAERTSQVAAVTDSLEENLELLCVTGVEDQLQVNVAKHQARISPLRIRALSACPS